MRPALLAAAHSWIWLKSIIKTVSRHLMSAASGLVLADICDFITLTVTACRTDAGYQIQHLNIWKLCVCVYACRIEERNSILWWKRRKDSAVKKKKIVKTQQKDKGEVKKLGGLQENKEGIVQRWKPRGQLAQNCWASPKHGTSLRLGHSHKFSHVATGFMHPAE